MPVYCYQLLEAVMAEQKREFSKETMDSCKRKRTEATMSESEALVEGIVYGAF